MKAIQLLKRCFFLFCIYSLCAGCASTSRPDQSDFPDSGSVSSLPLYHGQAPYSSMFNESRFASLLPQTYESKGQKVILIDPVVHAWGAYDAAGNLVKAGMATAGADYCPDEGRSCRTRAGTFRIYSLGDSSCVSRTYPLGEGGALMPYCMFFNGGQSLHGSPDQIMVAQNISHGCVHMRLPDAAWLRYNFAQIGTKVVVLPY